MDNYNEMIHLLENVSKVNRAVTLPFIQKKTGLKILDKGYDHGMIVTEADKKVSLYLLNGGIEGVEGIRSNYPGSFSEEDDSLRRLFSKEIYQIDPIDGTGDLVDTYQSQRVIGPTTLISKLVKSGPGRKFRPVSGMIFDNLNEIALISDGDNIGLYKIRENGSIKEVKYDSTEFNPSLEDPIAINRRVCYPQLTFDGSFMKFLSNNGFNIDRVRVGGAGISAMQFFRNYIQPKEHVQGFSDLEKISVLFNAQPDWKTWDTFPTEVIANALNLPQRTNVFGERIKENPNARELHDMIHTKGYVMAPTKEMGNTLTALARLFQSKNPDSNLLGKNYDYKNAIFHLKEIVVSPKEDPPKTPTKTQTKKKARFLESQLDSKKDRLLIGEIDSSSSEKTNKSLIYRLFGIVRNPNDFFSMVENKEIKDLNLLLGMKKNDYGVGWSHVCDYYPVVKANGHSVNLEKEGIRAILNIRIDKKHDLKDLELESEMFQKLMELQKHYEKKGFNVSVGNLTPEEAKEDFNAYVERKKKAINESYF